MTGSYLASFSQLTSSNQDPANAKIVYTDVINFINAFKMLEANSDTVEILQKHYDTYGRPLDIHVFRSQIIPMLETAGLIYQEEDLNDKRKKLIFISEHDEKQNNSERDGGVK